MNFTEHKVTKNSIFPFISRITLSMAVLSFLLPGKADCQMNSLVTFNWSSLGPTNIGGRTRAILIDNNDPTHQTIFAAGVSGGIWKSTNGGTTWDNTSPALENSLNDNLSNMNVCDIAQGSDGAIYIGTGEDYSLAQKGFSFVSNNNDGEMFSTGIIGGGIFKSTDDGVTWRLLQATAPTPDSDGVAWAYVNRIAAEHHNFKVIYAATNFGLYISHDSGASWGFAWVSPSQQLSGFKFDNSTDVTISADDSVIMAFVGGSGYYCYPLSGPDSIFTQINTNQLVAGYLGGNGNASLIEFAISPTDHNRVYASVINGDGYFGSGGNTSGIYMTENAMNNGGYWYLIGPGGSPTFDPYYGGGGDEADYDNALAVDPSNEESLFLGGAELFNWQQAGPFDTIGSWTILPGAFTVHTGQHTIVCDQNNPGVIYVGNDGGIYKSIDNGNTFAAYNRNYDVTQYFSVAFSSQVNPGNYEGFIGGTENNGTLYNSGADSYYPYDATEIESGDGGQAAISQLNSNIAFVTSDYGFLARVGNLSSLTLPVSFYTTTKGDSLGGNIDSVYTLGTGCYVTPLALYENPYDLNNLDSMLYVADANYSIGDTIYPVSPNGEVPFPYILTRPILKGDTITLPNRVVSKLAVAFTPANGFWVTAQADDLNGIVVWIPFGGPFSTPDACNNGAAVHCLAWSPDGDALWGGTEDGYLYRFTNMNSIIGNKYMSGALWYESLGNGTVPTAGNQVVCNNISVPWDSTNRDIISMAIDPQNGNNMIVTLGNYNNTTYIYYTSNALAISPAWQSAQGNLPAMPVYSSILDIKNGYGAGTWATNSAMVGTEHGIYITNNINSPNPTWFKNNGMANVLTAQIKQQTLEPWQCNNSGVIYVATHGRGVWCSNSTFVPTGVQQAANKSSFIRLNVYPNPMVNEGTLEYNLNSPDNLNMIIYDIYGNKLEETQLGTQAEGEHFIPLNGNNLKQGAYFIVIQGTSSRQVAKFVVVQ